MLGGALLQSVVWVSAASAATYDTEVELLASDGGAGDDLGTSVSISGDWAVVGAPDENAAYIYSRDQGGTGEWGQFKKITGSDTASGDLFGYSVSIEGDQLVVGAYGDNSFTGAAYVFRQGQGGADNWGQVRKITASDAATDDEFGCSVAIGSDYIVVGARRADTLVGAAYLFNRNSGGPNIWGQIERFSAPSPESLDLFGWSVGISSDGSDVIVGAPFDSNAEGANAGAAYVFEKDTGGSNNWGQQAELHPSALSAGDQFGFSVAISSNGWALVGAPAYGTNDTGLAFFFSRSGSTWSFVTGQGIAEGDAAGGTSVDLDEDASNAIFGAPGTFGSGSALIYSRSGSAWSKVEGVSASDDASGDNFGDSVSIDSGTNERTTLIGAPGHDHLGSGAGAAYIKYDCLATCCESSGCSDNNDCTSDSCDSGSGLCTNAPLPTTTVCRAANGACDVAETCDSEAFCPADSFASSTTVCRSSTGACDVAETCTGSSASCPADSFASSATTCRGSAGLCDQIEKCTGSSSVCPSDTFAPSGLICRPSTGTCDPQESCTGSSASCPSDAFASSSTVCRASTGTCDVAESCTGSSGLCPSDAFASSSTTCRGSAGLCDQIEKCTGSSASCPSDAFASSSTVCRASTGTCDVAESCTGSSASCPSDALASSSTVCRPSTGTCDTAESCTGSSASCPSDGFASSSTVCRASTGTCDVAESCTGSSASCPSDGFASSGTECRASAGDCDVAESCTGSSASCPSDVVADPGTTCRAAAGECDLEEQCDGVDAACPSDEKSVDVCRASTGECDVEETCDGLSNDCPVDSGLPDTDVDGDCDAVDPCTNVNSERDFLAKTKVVVAKINVDTTPGDDKLVISGTFLLPDGTAFADLMPDIDGARLRLETEAGAVIVDAELPGGTYTGSGTRGWKTNSKHSSWKYSDKTTSPIENITSLGVKDKSKKSPGLVSVKISGKKGTYPVLAGDEPVRAIVVLGNQTDAAAGWCAETDFTAADCSFNGSLSTLKCVSD